MMKDPYISIKSINLCYIQALLYTCFAHTWLNIVRRTGIEKNRITTSKEVTKKLAIVTDEVVVTPKASQKRKVRSKTPKSSSKKKAGSAKKSTKVSKKKKSIFISSFMYWSPSWSAETLLQSGCCLAVFFQLIFYV